MFNKIMREVKTVSGSLLTICLLLILLFFVLNFIRSRRIPYVSPVAGWAASHANGEAYDPIMVPAPAATSNAMINAGSTSVNSDMGPML